MIQFSLINQKIQAFYKAQFATQPFTLRINFIRIDDAEKIENEKISNRKTKEVLSIDLVRLYEYVSMINMSHWYECELEIKRTIGKNT